MDWGHLQITKSCVPSVLGAYLLSRAVKENQAMRLSRFTSRLQPLLSGDSLLQQIPAGMTEVSLVETYQRLYG